MADTYGLEPDSSCKLKIIRDAVESFVRKASEGGMKRKAKKLAQRTKPNTQSRLLALIAKIPRGKVSTYGAIARAAGIPNGARQTARALRGAHGVPVAAEPGRVDFGTARHVIDRAPHVVDVLPRKADRKSTRLNSSHSS